jgi:hypothetical protein
MVWYVDENELAIGGKRSTGRARSTAEEREDARFPAKKEGVEYITRLRHLIWVQVLTWNYAIRIIRG